jgi:hypothetical protein
MDLRRHPDLTAELITEAVDQLERYPELAPVTLNALRNMARDLAGPRKNLLGGGGASNGAAADVRI